MSGRTAAGAGEASRIREYVDKFASSAPATSTARRIRIDHVNPDDPDGKTFAISRQVIEFHPGTLVDTSAAQQCNASDADLLSQGAAACPAASIVGVGEIHIDTGVPGPFRIVANDLTLFNASHELIILSRSRDTPLPIPFVVREKVRGNTLDLSLPPLPGTPPDGAAPTLQDIQLFNRSAFVGGRRLHFMTTPDDLPGQRRVDQPDHVHLPRWGRAGRPGEVALRGPSCPRRHAAAHPDERHSPTSLCQPRFPAAPADFRSGSRAAKRATVRRRAAGCGRRGGCECLCVSTLIACGLVATV